VAHILAGTDLSPLSLDALARARMLAAATGSDLSVLHALGSDLTSPLRDLLGDDFAQQTDRATEAVAQALGDALDPTAPSRPVELVVEPGQAGTVVPAYARGAEADLVVLGARGAGALRRMLFGSTAAHLLRQSDVPVLIVRQTPAVAYRKVLVAVDRSPASVQLLDLLSWVAPEAELVLLHVVPTGTAQDNGGLEAWAAETGLPAANRASFLEVAGEPAEEILAHAEEHGCDLVAMGKHGTRAREERSLGSVTRTVVETGDRDVLVVVDPVRPEDAPRHGVGEAPGGWQTDTHG
jgi:nucleotide-binding universal stress UspA family protein